MHNRPRLQPEISEEERQERLKKIGKYCKLSDTLLSMRKGNVLTAEAFGLTQKILEINPEYYTLWNYRRDIALRLLEQNELSKPTLGESEKILTQMALEKNPKSYCAWYHRRWAAELGCLSMPEELATCTKFLNLDNRNFHCWDYRRYVVAASAVPASAELQYTSDKITQNFSNFSAWHYRTKLMPRVCSGDSQQLLATLDADFKLIQQAFYTEPDDQSAWLYHRWLLLTAKTHMDQAQYVTVLQRELATCDELLSIEPECKQALLSVALLLQQLIQLDAGSFDNQDTKTRVSDIFEKLRVIDPIRANYYHDIQAKV